MLISMKTLVNTLLKIPY